jgi:glycosyltransferase involved in cell wall biosynthesis
MIARQSQFDRVKEQGMRVLQFVKTSVGATWALRQMRELVKLGVEVHAALPPGPLVEKYESAGVTPHLFHPDLPVRRAWQIPAFLKQLRQLVHTVSPELIHSHFVGTTLAMRLALGHKHPIPRIFQVPGPLHLENGVFRRLEIGSAGKPDYWVGSCRWTCERYRRSGIEDKRIFLSYYGTDLDQFTEHPNGALRRELGITQDTKIAGMVAYMYAPKYYLGQTRGLKGHEDLIDALALCRQQDPQIMGVFIGGAWNNAVGYEQKIKTYAAQRCPDGIAFLGTRHDIPHLYPDFDVAVQASHSENVGGAVESLLLAVPTVTTNVGGFPDLVMDGKTGWLVPPRNPAQLADAILQALHDRQAAHERALAGQQLARELFDIKTTAQQIFDIYQTILGH